MADELKARLSFNLNIDELKIKVGEGEKSYDVASELYSAGTVTVTSGGELDMPFGGIDVAKQAWLYLKNLDDTNYVKYGPKDTTMKEFGRIGPGEEHWMKLAPSVTLRWIANVADCKVKYILLQETL